MFLIFKNLFLLCIAFNFINSSHEAFNEINMDLNKLSIANNELGLNLYKILAKESPQNLFFSPLSLSNAFGMLFAGAKDNTAKQLRSVLGYDVANLTSSEVPPAFNHYLNKVLRKNQPKEPDYVLNLANELLVSQDYNVNHQYKEEVQNQFHAFIKEVDFGKNAPQIKQEVNDWVKQQTQGKIDNLLSDLDPRTVLLILNAVYFKGNWKKSFEEELTKPQNFYNDGLDSKAKKVPLMHMTARLPFADVGNLKALELPYKGRNISMIVLLPSNRNGLKNMEDNITPDTFKRIQKQLRPAIVIITFPKFKVQYKRQLIPDFKKLGAKDVFIPGVADLSGMTPSQRLHVSEVIHKAAIEVNEEGSEAAAATAIGIVPYSLHSQPSPPPPQFTADHPFMYAIIDKRSDMILFLGRVTEL